MDLKGLRRNRTAAAAAKRVIRAYWHARALAIRGRFARMDNLRLHLGCGPVRLDGYVNIDADPAARADVFMDFRHLGRIVRPGTAMEILSIHSLSYLNLWQARDLFRSFHTLLKPGGRLIFELPDIEKCAHRLLEAGGAHKFSMDYLDGVRGFYAFGEDNLLARRDYQPYAFGWTGWHLKQELEDAGFADVAILEPRTHGHPWRDMRVEAEKG